MYFYDKIYTIKSEYSIFIPKHELHKNTFIKYIIILIFIVGSHPSLVEVLSRSSLTVRQPTERH